MQCFLLAVLSKQNLIKFSIPIVLPVLAYFLDTALFTPSTKEAESPNHLSKPSLCLSFFCNIYPLTLTFSVPHCSITASTSSCSSSCISYHADHHSSPCTIHSFLSVFPSLRNNRRHTQTFCKFQEIELRFP